MPGEGEAVLAVKCVKWADRYVEKEIEEQILQSPGNWIMIDFLFYELIGSFSQSDARVTFQDSWRDDSVVAVVPVPGFVRGCHFCRSCAVFRERCLVLCREMILRCLRSRLQAYDKLINFVILVKEPRE